MIQSEESRLRVGLVKDSMSGKIADAAYLPYEIYTCRCDYFNPDYPPWIFHFYALFSFSRFIFWEPSQME